MIHIVKQAADLILKVDNSIAFTILEIGARSLGGDPEPFYQLLDVFPGSQILAFEVDKVLCEAMNQTAKHGIRFFPTALGRTEETRDFYETRHPACCSLYKPNERLLSLYNDFEVSYLKSIGSIETVSLDYFAKYNDIQSVDFIKIDIQGAELDVFQGGHHILSQVVAIESEVEFIPLYDNQPLFGDVCAFLSTKNMMFHKFVSLAGRTLAPVIINNDVSTATQHCWSDALFIRDVLKIPELSPHKLLKLGMLGCLYGSPDLAFHCFQHYDKLNETNLAESFLALR
jgi:FkbM family methyltransferase